MVGERVMGDGLLRMIHNVMMCNYVYKYCYVSCLRRILGGGCCV